MTIATARSEMLDRLREVRTSLSLIKLREEDESTKISDETKILRGLFFVHLYGAFEFSVLAATQQAIQEIQTKRVKLSHLESNFHSIALNKNFQAHANSEKRQFRRRLDLLKTQNSEEECDLDDTIFGLKLQNIRADNLIEICESFCIPVLKSFDALAQASIVEVVDRRNSVAHGRESAVQVGARINHAQLERRFLTVFTLCSELADSLEACINELSFVKQQNRNLYKLAE